MRERGSDAIVHVAARQGLEKTAGMATYGVSEADLVHLTRVLDVELRPLGIRVNAVAPQIIDTAKNRPYLTAELLAHAVSPEAIADLIVYLVKDTAAPFSGAVLPPTAPKSSLPVARLERTSSMSSTPTTTPSSRRTFLACGAALAAIPAIATLVPGVLAEPAAA